MSKQNGSPAKAPVHEVRLGRIKAAVWENTTENGVRHNVTLSRLYKDGTQWKDSASFGRVRLVSRFCQPSGSVGKFGETGSR